jgi:hypothetical protein
LPKYIVSYDVIVPGILEVQADNEEAAVDIVASWNPRDLLKYANTESTSVSESIHVEDIVPSTPETKGSK